MNTSDNPHPDPHRDPRSLMPGPADEALSVPREGREPAEVMAVPEAVRAAQVARTLKHDDTVIRGRGVEWVRPTDLIARHSAHAAGRGLDFQAELARRTRTPIGAGVRRLGDRARRLPPISAFGHSSTPVTRQVSRSGVSMG